MKGTLAERAGSVLSFPDRGPWGDPRWRGNASGRVLEPLIAGLKPKSFADPMMGSGTFPEAAKALGVPKVAGLDLHRGFDLVSMSLLERLGEEYDLVLAHPPYWNIIRYSGEVWGQKPDPRDLSHVEDWDEFIDRLHAAILNMREATRPGGHYGVLVGDIRREGRYYSMQAELIARLPRGELRTILIKVQHNVRSDRRGYALRYPRILHEYLLLWERQGTLYAALGAGQVHSRRAEGTWRAVVHAALLALGGEADLEAIYGRVFLEAPEKVRANPHWREKVRQTLQRHFEPRERGRWALGPAATKGVGFAK